MSEPTVTSGFLKNMKTGVVLRRTDILAAKSNMVPCDVHGNIDGQHEADLARVKNAMQRRKTKYLGNTLNGALENFSDVLAERETMISMDSFEEWERYKAGRIIPAPIDDTADEVAPVLARRETAPAASPTKEKITPPVVTGKPDESNTLPDIAELGSREAKTVLSQWAETHYGHKLDRRPGLDEVVAACQLLIDNAIQSAAG